jgi:translation initiation factor IF-2
LANKLRVYELARHYGVDSKEIMRLLQNMRVEVKSHMSVVEHDAVDKIHAGFQHKRELARVNYAKAHSLDPEKLMHVASLKPLPRPQPAPEKKKDRTPTKKKVAKKKAPTKKVVVITKPGTQTAVAKKAAAERAAAERAAAKKAAEDKAAAESLEAKRVALRKQHAVSRRQVRKLVRKAPRDEPAVAEVAKSSEAVAAPPVEEKAVAKAAPKVEPGAAPKETATAAVEAKAEAPSGVKPEAPVAEGPAVDQAGVGASKEAAVETPVGDEDSAKKRQDVSRDVKESVKESVKAAIRRRRDERAAQAEVAPRRKRARQKRKKIDEAEVERQVKQTIAQMEVGQLKRRRKKGGPVETVAPDDVLRVTEFITVQELAEKLEVPPKDIITKLFELGVMVTINKRLEKEHIELLADEYEKGLEFLSEYGEELLEQEEIAAEDLQKRPPVVTVMGHVDHGKTSLLDYIRKTNVIAGEAGGITQHIGAYTVETPGGPITFLDTPGHAAFTAMRARGAQVTDIVILVVAADDRVMPQTIEAINHAKAAGVPVIVAINKIDLPSARAELVKQELTQYGIVVEEFGGQALYAEISAKKGTNVDKLLDLVHLQAEVLELSASRKGSARGVVVEASKEQGRGVVFTVLIEKGVLRVGDIFLVGMRDGRVRALFNERGDPLTEVFPGEPAVVLGAHDVPEAGDKFYVLEHERDAREIAIKRRSLQRQQQLTSPRRKIGLDNLAIMIETQDLKELPIIVKGDVAGSVEALCDQLMQLNTEEVMVRVIHKAVGAVNESDVLLAANTGAMIIGFHLRPGMGIQDLARQEHVTIEVFDVIYEAVDTLKKAMAGLLGTVKREVSTGSAAVRQVFHIPKLGSIAGSYVLDGKITRNSRARLVREEVVIFEGRINSLKRFKDDAREVTSGYECGIGLENCQDLAVGDVIEAYEIEEIVRTEL